MAGPSVWTWGGTFCGSKAMNVESFVHSAELPKVCASLLIHSDFYRPFPPHIVMVIFHTYQSISSVTWMALSLSYAIKSTLKMLFFLKIVN